jgi:hypothetical protein
MMCKECVVMYLSKSSSEEKSLNLRVGCDDVHRRRLLAEARHAALLGLGAIGTAGDVGALHHQKERKVNINIVHDNILNEDDGVKTHVVVGVAAVGVGVDETSAGVDGVAALYGTCVSKGSARSHRERERERGAYRSVPVDGDTVDQSGAAAAGVPVEASDVARTSGD